MDKLQEELRKKIGKLLNDYGKPIKINQTQAIGIYIKSGESIALEQFGIASTNDSQVFISIDTQVNEDDLIQIEGINYRVKGITTYFGIVKKLTLEKENIG